MNSSRDLGINAPEHEVMLFRRVTTYAPLLAEEKYGSVWEPAENFQGQWPVPGDSLRLYSMRKSLLEFGNVTFVRSNFTKLLAVRMTCGEPRIQFLTNTLLRRSSTHIPPYSAEYVEAILEMSRRTTLEE